MIKWFQRLIKEEDPALAIYPLFWQMYLDEIRNSPPPETPLSEVRFVVFDTETTGLNVKTDQILSIGAMAVQGWQMDLRDTYETLVYQDYVPVESAVKIHGLLPIQKHEGLPEEEAVISFLQYCKNSILVGHHVQFDVAMINQSLKNLGVGPLSNFALDTNELENRLAGSYYYSNKLNVRSLDFLCQKHNITINDRHTAAGDAFMTALIFLKQLDQLEKRKVTTLGELLR